MRLSSTSIARAVAAYFAAAEPAMPPAAAAAVRQGSSAREKEFISSTASAPELMSAPASVKAAPAMARQPARVI